ncbi:MAG: hypothetical protein M2R45_02171 [Verrucomicrobia subdivision 3 bacterium]|nr:hypothetical protein [Limisphaerales bacterium]MCS1413747.1 hypothetical protein [Limisphaerales bacterium]
MNFNTEPLADDGDLPTNWNSVVHVLAVSPFGHYECITFEDRKHSFGCTGAHAGLPVLATGTCVAASDSFTAPARRWPLSGKILDTIYISLAASISW